MADESSLWKTMQGKLRNVPQFKFQRHEDRYSTGIPDTSFSGMGLHGWIELKRLAKWPARAQTIVRMDHFTQDQRLWIKEHGERGGLVWVLVQIADDYMLFDWHTAQDIGVNMTRVDMLNRARGRWHKKLDILELLACAVQRVTLD